VTSLERPPAVALPLRRKLMHGLIAALLHEGVSVVLSLAAMAVLVRLLTPVDYGQAAAAVGVLGLLATFGAGPIVSHALQYPAGEEPEWSQYLTLALAAQAAVFALTNTVAAVCWLAPATRGIAPLLHIASVGMLIEAFNVVGLLMARRQLEFTRLKVLASTSVALRLAASLALAWAGFGAAALVIGGNIVSAIPGAFDLIVVRKYRPAHWWRPDMPLWRRATRFGAQQITMSLALTLRGAIEAVVLPAWVGAAGLGLFTRAQALFQTTAGRFAIVVSELVYPVLPRDAGVPARFAMLATRYLEAILVLALGGAALIALKGPALSRVLYGAAWIEADPLLTPGALASAAAIIGAAGVSVLVAAGRARRAMQIQIGSAALACAALAPAIFGGRLYVYAWALAAAHLAGAVVSLYATSSFLRGDWILRSVVPAVATVTGAVLVTMFADRFIAIPGLGGLIVSTTVFGVSALLVLRITASALVADMVGVLPVGAGIRRALLIEPQAGAVAIPEPGVLP
jgi:O-antigen/teichoic acid export membrane protein